PYHNTESRAIVVPRSDEVKGPAAGTNSAHRRHSTASVSASPSGSRSPAHGCDEVREEGGDHVKLETATCCVRLDAAATCFIGLTSVWSGRSPRPSPGIVSTIASL